MTDEEQAEEKEEEPPAKKRFPSLSEEQKDELAGNRISKSTVKTTKFGVKVFQDWLEARGKSTSFEGLSSEELAQLLHSFYAETRDKDGKRYSHSTLRGIRSSINRHLRMPPHNRQLDITKDKAYIQANFVFDGYIKANIMEGNAKVSHKASLNDTDWEKLMSSHALDVNTPTGLQNKVFVDLMTHFARRGREGLRSLKKTSFVNKTDENGQEYVERVTIEISKNHQGLDIKDREQSRVMAAQSGDDRCPVNSFMKYISKLDDECDILFTYPLMYPKPKQTDHTWYGKKPLGENSLSGMMGKLSTEANLSQRYTNHCLRATIATRLSKAGVESRKIIGVTGHKNESSLKHYVAAPTTSEKRQLSSIIHSIKPSKDVVLPLKQLEPSSAVVSIPGNEMMVHVPTSTGSVTNQSAALFAGAVFHTANIVINNHYNHQQ